MLILIDRYQQILIKDGSYIPRQIRIYENIQLWELLLLKKYNWDCYQNLKEIISKILQLIYNNNNKSFKKNMKLSK